MGQNRCTRLRLRSSRGWKALGQRSSVGPETLRFAARKGTPVLKSSCGIVYSPEYDIRYFGLEKLHPFDSCKYGRAWSELTRKYGDRLKECWLRPTQPISNKDLALIHSEAYLNRL